MKYAHIHAYRNRFNFGAQAKKMVSITISGNENSSSSSSSSSSGRKWINTGSGIWTKAPTSEQQLREELKKRAEALETPPQINPQTINHGETKGDNDVDKEEWIDKEDNMDEP